MSSTSSPEWTTETTTDATADRAPSAVVDPGQVIRVKAHFPNAPANVLFSFLAPGTDRAFHDPGCHDIASRIIRDGNVYSFWIDTTGMVGGEGWWRFFSEDPDSSKQRSKIGKFIIRDDVPAALLQSPASSATTFLGGRPRDDGLSLLGTEGPDDDTTPTVVLVAGGLGLALGLLFAR